VRFDEIGYWSELKLEVVQSYALEYSRILAAQRGLSHVYIDGFSGPGVHVSKATGTLVPGSPLNAVWLDPAFDEYFLIDLDGDKVDHLRSHVGEEPHIHILQGDCNDVLLSEVFPQVEWRSYRRGLCLLDPYGLHLDWKVVFQAGQMRSLEIFLNFPIMDMNRNVLWRHKDGPTPEHRARMTRFWGDDSWSEAAYRRSAQMSLFEEEEFDKVENEAVAEAFRTRLIDVAGFNHVAKPLPMRNSRGAVVYYLFFASQNDTGLRIVNYIFDKYRDRQA
jgi:three-Cys-motif partner protein